MREKRWIVAVAIPLAILPFLLVGIGAPWLHMTTTLALAKMEGIYPSAEEGFRSRLQRSYTGIERIEIEHAGPNSFDGSNPHVWFVAGKVWAAQRSNGEPLHSKGYDFPGSYFLRVREGWVHVPEGRLPELVGAWMRLFHYSG